MVEKDAVNLDLEKLKQELGEIVKKLGRKLAADVVTLLLYDETTGQFCLPIGHGLRDESVFTDLGMRPCMARIAGKVVKKQKKIIAESIHGHPVMDRPFVRREKIISAAAFPVIDKNKSVGILFVNYRKQHVFSKKERKITDKFIKQTAEIISKTKISPAICQTPPLPQSTEQQALNTIAKFACELLNKPVAFWLLEQENQTLHVRTMTGLTKEYMNDASARLGDGSVISAVIETGEKQIVRDLQNDLRFPYPAHARNAAWISLAALPIKFQNKAIGVIEVFTFEAFTSNDPQEIDDSAFEAINQFAEMAGIIIEKLYHSLRYEKLAHIAGKLSAAPGFDSAMQVIVDSACELTGADSSEIFLYEKQADRFIVGAQAPLSKSEPKELPRLRKGGFTEQIIKTGESRLIEDITREARAKESVIREGVRSMIGVRVQMETENIGVIYVRGNHPNQFTEDDVRLLETLANYASVALGWARFLLKPSDDIEKTTSELFRLKDILDKLCLNVQETFNFQFTSIQMIRREENIIETVHGTGIAKEWVGRSKHYLEADPELRDIEADIALAEPLRIEIISGWDDRFDRWVYDEFRHEQLVRIWVPMAVVKDREGKILENWYEDAKWKVSINTKNETGQRIVIDLDIKHRNVQLIGTVSAGYLSPQNEITAKRAIELFQYIAREVINVHRASLSYVLETIVERARNIVHADSGSLHLFDPPQEHFIHNVLSGSIGKLFLEDAPIRSEGLGRQAIKEGKPKFIPDRSQGHDEKTLKVFNPKAFEQGIKAIAAFPLIFGENRGVLYIHYHQPHRFTEDEIGWCNFSPTKPLMLSVMAPPTQGFVTTLENCPTCTRLRNHSQANRKRAICCTVLPEIR